LPDFSNWQLQQDYLGSWFKAFLQSKFLTKQDFDAIGGKQKIKLFIVAHNPVPGMIFCLETCNGKSNHHYELLKTEPWSVFIEFT